MRKANRFKGNSFCRTSDNTVDYVVAFESIVNDAFKNDASLCKILEIVKTPEPLEQFLSGYLYSKWATGANGTRAKATRDDIDRRILEERRKPGT